MSEAKLFKTTLNGCDMHLAKFINAGITDCSFKECNLLSDNLSGASVSGTSFEDCDMQHMIAERSYFFNSAFKNIKMNHTSINGAVFYGNKFDNVITASMLVVETKMDMDAAGFSKSRIVDLKNISKEN